jgi:hypothetical protein
MRTGHAQTMRGHQQTSRGGKQTLHGRQRTTLGGKQAPHRPPADCATAASRLRAAATQHRVEVRAGVGLLFDETHAREATRNGG